MEYNPAGFGTARAYGASAQRGRKLFRGGVTCFCVRCFGWDSDGMAHYPWKVEMVERSRYSGRPAICCANRSAGLFAAAFLERPTGYIWPFWRLTNFYRLAACHVTSFHILISCSRSGFSWGVTGLQDGV